MFQDISVIDQNYSKPPGYFFYVWKDSLKKGNDYNENIILFWELQEAQNEHLSTDLLSHSLWTILQRDGFPEKVTFHLKDTSGIMRMNRA